MPSRLISTFALKVLLLGHNDGVTYDFSLHVDAFTAIVKAEPFAWYVSYLRKA